MKKIIPLILLFFLCIMPAEAIVITSMDSLYQNAFDAAHKKDWETVKTLLSAQNDEKMQKIFTWLYLLDENEPHSFEDIADFLEANPTWPKQAALKKQLEKAINDTTDKKRLRKWFATNEPITMDGIKRYIELFGDDEKETKTKAIKKMWMRSDLSSSDEKEFLSDYKSYLTEKDYITKIDQLLWRNEISKAKELLKELKSGFKELFATRIALKNKKKDAEKGIAKIPPALKNNPALAFDLAVYYRRTNRIDKAIAIHKSPAALKGSEEKWYNEKTNIYYRLLAEKKYKEAYDLFAENNHGNATLYVHSEWNAAFVAYRFLKDYNTALLHLNNMERKSTSAVSRARIHYYTGLCLEKLNRDEDAKEEFRNGSNYNMSFYGQLASAKTEPVVKQIARHNITSNNFVKPSREAYESVANNELISVLKILEKYSQTNLSNIFTARLGYLFNKKDEILALSLIYYEMGKPELIVGLSRRLRLKGMELGHIAFPKPKYKIPLFVDKNLAYAIMRQESDFNPRVISHAKAMGLMQVLPSTAKRVADSLKEKNHSTSRLLNDPEYNILIGTNYIESLIKKFNGSYILAIAAYNAGPANVNKWIKNYGELGSSEEDILTWIETIPFSETRNYVQRVLENLYIYRIIAAQTTSV